MRGVRGSAEIASFPRSYQPGRAHSNFHCMIHRMPHSSVQFIPNCLDFIRYEDTGCLEMIQGFWDVINALQLQVWDVISKWWPWCPTPDAQKDPRAGLIQSDWLQANDFHDFQAQPIVSSLLLKCWAICSGCDRVWVNETQPVHKKMTAKVSIRQRENTL